MKKIQISTILLFISTFTACKKENQLENKCRIPIQIAAFSESNNTFQYSQDISYNGNSDVESILYSSGSSSIFEYNGNIINVYDKATNNLNIRYELNAAGYYIKRTYYKTNSTLLTISSQETITRNAQNYVTKSVYTIFSQPNVREREITSDYQINLFNQNLMSERMFSQDVSYNTTNGNIVSNEWTERLSTYSYDESQLFFEGYNGGFYPVPLHPNPKNRVSKFTLEYKFSDPNRAPFKSTTSYDYINDTNGRPTKINQSWQSGVTVNKSYISIKYPC